MKKRFLIVLSALLVFGLAAAAFAYSRADNSSQNSTTSCPMQKQSASTGEHSDSCCGMADCCKDGKCSMGGACCKDKDSCPMKQKGESNASGKMNMSKVTFVGGDSSADCCTKGGDCCQGGSACCKHKN